MPKTTSRHFIHLFLSLFFLVAASIAQARPAKTAVVVIDMQDGFIKHLSPEIGEDLKEEILDLLEWANREQVPVLTFEYKNWGTTTSKLNDFMEKMPQTRTVTKDHDDGFRNAHGDEAEKVLKSWGSQNLIVSGINAHYCVKSTAEGALKRGFTIWTAGTIVAQGGSSVYPNKEWWLTGTSFFGFMDLLSLIDRLPVAF